MQAPDERVVYLALINVFTGPNAELRRSTPIRKLVKKNRDQPDVANLISAHSLETLCSTARNLLTAGVFTSTLTAKRRFPEVFDVSPIQSAERAASEAEAARHEACAIEEFAHLSEDKSESTVQNRGDRAFKGPRETRQSSRQEAHTLYPVYFPIKTQHVLLAKVQGILEKACFSFGSRAMPDLLQKYEWDCPEAAELNRWTTEFSRRLPSFAAMGKDVGRPLEKLLQSIASIRHTAVHRLKVSAKSLEQFLLDAELFLNLLDEHAQLNLITNIRCETQAAAEELERNKHILTVKIEEVHKRTAIQRAELELAEQKSIAEILQEDASQRILAGSNLERAIDISHVSPPTNPSSHDVSSDLEDVDSAEEREDYGETEDMALI